MPRECTKCQILYTAEPYDEEGFYEELARNSVRGMQNPDVDFFADGEAI